MSKLNTIYMLMLLTQLIVVSVNVARGQEYFYLANESSIGAGGYFCYCLNGETNSTVNLLKISNDHIEHLFSHGFSDPGECPICLSNTVIDVAANGSIRKLNFRGDLIFNSKLEGFNGAAAMSGKLLNGWVYVVQSIIKNDGSEFAYQLWFVDVAGLQPIKRGEYDIVRPVKIVQTNQQIIIVGLDNVLRINVPMTP